MIVGRDTGGTFTDFILITKEKVFVHKRLYALEPRKVEPLVPPRCASGWRRSTDIGTCTSHKSSHRVVQATGEEND
jgi:hypothetical protein